MQRFSTARTASFNDTEISAIGSWSDEEKKNVCLTIWVDASCMQIALCPVKAQKKTIYMTPLKIHKASEVYNNFENFRSSLASYKCTVAYATMSFAGPVSQDHVVITNWLCEARERVIHFTTLPFDLFPLDRRLFMNDLEAASYGIIAHFVTGSLPKIFHRLWTPKDAPREILKSLDGASLVIWLGAGFNGSFICRNDTNEYNCVVSSETGHAQFYGVAPWSKDYENEVAFTRFVSQKLHGDAHQPEWEDMGAHRGLELAYQFIKSQKGDPLEKPPKYDEIRRLALERNPDAIRAFHIHYNNIMRAAQSMVLTVRCQRVFIISETQVKNVPVITEFAEELHQTFIDHPRQEWVDKIEFYVQKDTSTFPLSGGLFLSKMFAVTHLKQSHMNDF